MTEITHKTPTPRTNDTPIGKMMGYLSEIQTYLKFESFAEAVRVTWVLDFWPLSYVEDALVGIVQWAYNNAYQNAYNSGADRGNEINKEILGWIEDLRNQTMDLIGKLDRARIDAENWLSDHEKRIKDLESKIGKPLAFSELLKLG
jgi:hypothetical protein